MEGPLKLRVDTDPMAKGHRHAHRRRRNREARQMQDLARLVDHFMLFLGVAVLQEAVDVGQDIAVDRVGVKVLRSIPQIIKPLLAGA